MVAVEVVMGIDERVMASGLEVEAEEEEWEEEGEGVLRTTLDAVEVYHRASGEEERGYLKVLGTEEDMVEEGEVEVAAVKAGRLGRAALSFVGVLEKQVPIAREESDPRSELHIPEMRSGVSLRS